MVKNILLPSAATTTTTTTTESPEGLVFLDEQECCDLSYWEFINQSDADSDTESLHSVENGFVAWYSLKPPNLQNTNQEIQSQESLEDQDLVSTTVDSHGDGGDQYDYREPTIFPGVGYGIHVGLNYKEDEEENEDDDEDDGLDDELVPWHLSGKLGRQRMRKLGKRDFSKIGNSKRNPYAYVKPGCVHGKHGLGFKA